jgi:hypothetical protein
MDREFREMTFIKDFLFQLPIIWNNKPLPKPDYVFLILPEAIMLRILL